MKLFKHVILIIYFGFLIFPLTACMLPFSNQPASTELSSENIVVQVDGAKTSLLLLRCTSHEYKWNVYRKPVSSRSLPIQIQYIELKELDTENYFGRIGICFSPDDGDYYLYLNCTGKTSESAPSVSDSAHSNFYPHVIENGVTVQYIYFAYLPELPANYTVYIDQDAIKVVQ